MTERPRPIALLTDFGTDDWYVAAMKGEILKRLPDAQIIDITHAIPPGNVAGGAFALRLVLDSMPPRTVFCCVVDPGVGTSRRAICGRVGSWGFAGPDNGLVTPIIERAGDDVELHEIQNPAFRSPNVSDTFHGRDLFAHAAACLAGGAPPDRAGPRIDQPVVLPPCEPHETPKGVAAQVIWIDRFGNLITNIAREKWRDRLDKRRFTIRAGSLTVDCLNRTFGEVEAGGAVAYWGSTGMLEVGINRGSAAEVAGLSVGDPILIEWLG